MQRAVRSDLAKAGKNSKQVSRRSDLILLIHNDSCLTCANFHGVYHFFLHSEMHIGAELGQFAIRVGHLSTETVPMSTICFRKL